MDDNFEVLLLGAYKSGTDNFFFNIQNFYFLIYLIFLNGLIYKGIMIRNKEGKLALLTDDMIAYVENTVESSKENPRTNMLIY